MTFFDPDANLVLHVLCLTRTSGSWLTIRPSSFNLNWFVLFRAASGCNLFAFHRSCTIIHFHRRFSLLTKPLNREQEVGGGWARVKNWGRCRRRGISPTISPTWISRSHLKLLAPVYFIETFQLERVPFSISSLLEESVNHLSSSTNRYPLSLFSVSSY